MVGEEQGRVDDIAVRAWDAEYASERCGPAAAWEGDLPPGRVIRSGGVPLRGCLGGGRAAAGVGVIEFEGAELDAEAGVKRRRQRGQRSQREVLPAAQDLADPPRGYAHPGREVGSGQAALAQAPVDLVRELGDEGEHLLVDLGLRGPLIGRNA